MSTLYVHGWGESSSIWPVNEGFFYDRGYFGNPTGWPTFSNKIVAHSFGLHSIPRNILESTGELVIISSFLTLKSKKRIIEKMISKMEIDPMSVLKLFNPQFDPESQINKNLLIEDLIQLSDTIFDPEILKEIPKITLIHGEDDAIVPFQLGLELHAKLPTSYFQAFRGDHFECIQEAYRKGFL